MAQSSQDTIESATQAEGYNSFLVGEDGTILRVFGELSRAYGWN
jgi:hypothetical protein